jgi:N-acyl-D-aspartate/D-glutamate deacylase
MATHCVSRATWCLAAWLVWVGSALAQEFDLVLAHGRVLDPETRLDAIRHVGIRAGVIRAVSENQLHGPVIVDAAGLVIAPGFIDLHQHAHRPEDYELKAQDGVTTAFELEVGTLDVDAWYAARAGQALIHHGVSVGHIPCRMAAMGDRPGFLPGANSATATNPASDAQLAELRRLIEHGLERGAVAVGFGIQYTPGATQWEILELFRAAAQFRAACSVHIRAKGDAGPHNVFSSLEELIAATAVTGAPAHICHIQSTANRLTPRALELITAARGRGLDISVECYPYTAGMTDIRSAIFDPGWQQRAGITFNDLQWPATGERLTAESFAKFRQTGGMVIVHSNPETVVRHAVMHPHTMIASDGLRGHPRHAGTSARLLGHYVRETQALTLMQAVEKLSLLPARRLEERVPAMKTKGRVQVGADADLVVFDATKVHARATYEQPDRSSEGIRDVLVGGVFVVRDGELQRGMRPGRAVRAPIIRAR